MHLIVTGATGYLATEVIRQALSHPRITSVLAVARRAVSAPEGVGADEVKKLQSVVVKNYDEYGEDVKARLKGGDACIWTVAVTPSKSRTMDFAAVSNICKDYTLLGLEAMAGARKQGEAKTQAPPLKFVYVSGEAAERDQSKTPRFMPAYSSMRGATETQVLSYATANPELVEACIAKPGLITSGALLNRAFATVMGWAGVVSSVKLEEIAAALLHEVVEGFEKETLLNEDLVRIGRGCLTPGEERKM